MGNHHSHDSKDGEGLGSRGGSRRSQKRGSGSEDGAKPPPAPERSPPSLVPVDKLAKLLCQRAQKEEGVSGVTENSFTKYVFPLYPEIARRFFAYMRRASACKSAHVPAAAFRAHCERVLALLDDTAIIETFVRMFGCESEEDAVAPGGLRALLFASYKLSMDHYPEGPQTCLMINRTLDAVVNGCFNNKEAHSVGFVVRWLAEHCHRVVFPIHRYCVHVLATRHRDLAAAGTGSGADGAGAGLELGTPVLEAAGTGAGLGARAAALLPLSAAWLLAAAAPPLYSRPLHLPAGGGTSSAVWLARLVCCVPVHWAPLYRSSEHGAGTNRFLHHTLLYRGPTLVVFGAQDLVVAVLAPQEWRESHQYFGTADSALIQLQPTFSVVSRAPRSLYLNTHIRGYPRGLRAGADPRSPLLSVNEDFDQLTFKGVPYSIDCIEVWGCGEQAALQNQLEIKKWQVKEAERQRQVKFSPADWLDHPDRYLLELAGRPQYNNSGS